MRWKQGENLRTLVQLYLMRKVAAKSSLQGQKYTLASEDLQLKKQKPKKQNKTKK